MNIWSKNIQDTKYSFVKGYYTKNVSDINTSKDKFVLLDIQEDVMTALDMIDMIRSNHVNVVFCLLYSIENLNILSQLSRTKEFMTAVKLTKDDLYIVNIVFESGIDYVYLENPSVEFMTAVKSLRDNGFYKTRAICDLDNKIDISEYISITDIGLIESI